MYYCFIDFCVIAGPSTIKAANQSLPTSTACQNSAHTGDHASNSSCSLSHEVNVEPVERVALPDEQKSLHIYLKTEMAKVFEVLKLSVAVLTFHSIVYEPLLILCLLLPIHQMSFHPTLCIACFHFPQPKLTTLKVPVSYSFKLLVFTCHKMENMAYVIEKFHQFLHSERSGASVDGLRLLSMVTTANQ